MSQRLLRSIKKLKFYRSFCDFHLFCQQLSQQSSSCQSTSNQSIPVVSEWSISDSSRQTDIDPIHQLPSQTSISFQSQSVPSITSSAPPRQVLEFSKESQSLPFSFQQSTEQYLVQIVSELTAWTVTQMQRFTRFKR